MQFSKPVKLRELTQAIAKLLVELPRTRFDRSLARRTKAECYVVDDDDQVRAALSAVLDDEGHAVDAFASCEAFLDAFHPEKDACLLIDAYLPGMSGLQLLRKLTRATGIICRRS